MEKPDKYHGQGGSYIVDPATGERILESQTALDDKHRAALEAEIKKTEALREAIVKEAEANAKAVGDAVINAAAAAPAKKSK